MQAAAEGSYSTGVQPVPRTSLLIRGATLSSVVLWSAAVSGCALLAPESSAGPRHCPPTVQKVLAYPEKTFSVTYREPETQVNGERLQTLSHITLYLDDGRGAEEYTKVDATNRSGGREVSREVTIPLQPGERRTFTICANATNSAGPGPSTP